MKTQLDGDEAATLSTARRGPMSTCSVTNRHLHFNLAPTGPKL